MIDRIRKISNVIHATSLCLLAFFALFYFEIIPFVSDDVYQAVKETVHSHDTLAFGLICGLAILAALSNIMLWLLKDKSAEFHYEQMLKSSQKTSQVIEAKHKELNDKVQGMENNMTLEKSDRAWAFENHLNKMNLHLKDISHSYERVQLAYQSATVDIQSVVKATLSPEQSNHDVFVEWDKLHPPPKPATATHGK